jgi:selenide,water dikinase
MQGSDDAGVYKIDDNKAIVQTVDIITPVVDNPYLFGQIAAANSLSDIFAMGGDVITAMNVVGFDKCNHSYDVLKEILKGGEDKVKECGAVIIGGHTIETSEMLYGLSVTGIINPNKVYRNNTLRVDDVLILTKPLGMGVLTTALKSDLIDKALITKISKTLSQLNYKASTIMKEFDVSACTDVTGFGLAGHANKMCQNKFTIEFDFKDIPFIEEAKELAEKNVIPGGSLRNKIYLEDKVKIINKYENEILFYDAQTSGGLLMAVSQKDANSLLKRLKNEDYSYSSIIGIVKNKEDKNLIIK